MLRKQGVILLLLVFVSASPLYGLDLAAGIDLHYSPYFLRTKIDDNFQGSLTLVQMSHDFGASLFFDATYVRLDVEYTMAMQGNNTQIDNKQGVVTSSSTAGVANYQKMDLNFALIGKYPLEIDTLRFWPAVGLEFSLPLLFDADGDGKNDLGTTNADRVYDFYILAGLGMDLMIGKHFVLTPNFLVGSNITPKPFVAKTSNKYTFSGYKLKMGLSAGYRF